jgi:serine protease Do
MTTLLRRVILSASGALACAAASSQPLNPALFLPIASSIVRVEAERVQGGLSVGSGVTVAPEVIATNCHVVRDASSIRVAGAGATWPVDGEHADPLRDVCFLRVPGWAAKPVELARDGASRIGASVIALGYTGGAAISPRMGNVTAVHSFEDAGIIESNAPFNSGSSGGGLFSQEGALLGLLTFRLRNSEDAYFALPVDWVKTIPGEGDWQPVHPLAGARPFWQGDVESLPFFMRAAAYENDRAWNQLLSLAQRWARSAPRDVAPLRATGRALRELHRPREAAQAFRLALRLEPLDAASLYGLALAYDESGDRNASHVAEARLDALEGDLARSLAERLASRGAIEPVEH